MAALQILSFNLLAGGSLIHVLQSSSSTSSPTPGRFLQILLCLSPSKRFCLFNLPSSPWKFLIRSVIHGNDRIA